MASISVYSIGNTSFSAKLIGLQTTGVNYTRDCRWNVRESSSNNTVDSFSEDITAGKTEGAAHTITGLSPNTNYSVNCTVYRADTGAYLNSFSASVKTSGSGGSGGGDSGGGDDDDSPWTATDGGIINVTTFERNVDMTLKSYYVYRYSVTFSYSGYAHFYTNGDVNTIGYLSTNNSWSSDNSGPLSSVASDDNSYDGTNFDIRYYVKANTTYYIYVRGKTGQETGYVSLWVSEPWEINSLNLGTPTGDQSLSLYLNASTVYCRQVSFNASGLVTVSLLPEGGSVDCWISESSSSWSHNKPTSRIKYIEDGGTATFDATVGQVYYIWLRCWTSTMTKSVTLNITIPEFTIKKWSWITSNGSASLSVTTAARNAVQKQESTRNFSHLVWDDMVDKVQALISKTTKVWDTNYATYSNTKAITNANGEYELTAVMFNSLRNNLELVGLKVGLTKIPSTTDHDNAPSGTIPHPVMSGKKVFGHYFLTLTDYMNSCIDKL